jgi:hypothetical protein
VRPLAEEIAKVIVTRQEDDRPKCMEDGSVRVLSGKMLPAASAVMQTLMTRRKRCLSGWRPRAGAWRRTHTHSVGEAES